MEALPLELREEIFSYLLPPVDRKNVITAPVFSKAERSDVYNLRLTSRHIKAGASQTFLKIIENGPTDCVEKSMQYLANLIEATEGELHITCLTFNTCRLHFTEKQKLPQINKIAEVRSDWIDKSFGTQILNILRKTPRLRHLVCCLEATRGSEVLQFGGGQMFALERIAERNVSDPLQYIHKALQATGLNQTLETLAVITASLDCYPGEATPWRKRKYLSMPKLQHLTLSASYFDLATLLIYSPNITSWHILLDERAVIFDPPPTLSPSSPEMSDVAHKSYSGNWYIHRIGEIAEFDQAWVPTDADAVEAIARRRSYIISGKGQHIQTDVLANCVAALLRRIEVIPWLTVRDMVIVRDINEVVLPFVGIGRIENLVFEEVKHCYTDEITLSGPSRPISLNSKCAVYTRICERAQRVVLKTDGVERTRDQ